MGYAKAQERGGLLDVFNSQYFKAGRLCEDYLSHRNDSGNESFAGSVNISQSSNSSSLCFHQLDLHTFYSSMPAVSLTVVFCLSFLVKRRSWKLNFCHGLPGIVYPINTLEMRHTQFLYCLAFGVVAHLLHNIIFGTFRNPFHLQNLPKYIEIMIKLLAVAVYGIALYPLFACISLGTVISFLCGTIYIWMYTYVNLAGLYSIDGCNLSLEQYILITVRHLPFLFCMCTLCVVLPFYSIMQFRKGNYLSHFHTRELSHLRYTKKILSRRVKHQKNLRAKMHHELSKVSTIHTREQISYFTYPPALLGSLCVAFVIVYMSAVVVFVEVRSYLLPMLDAVHECATGQDERAMKQVFLEVMYGEMNPVNRSVLKTTTVSALNVLRVVEYVTSIAKVCFEVALSIAVLMNMIQIPFILISFKRNMLSVYRGKYLDVKPAEYAGTPARLLVSFTKYTGYQIAYLSWAIVIQAYVLCCIFLTIAFIIFIPVWNDFGDICYDIMLMFVPALFFSLTLNYSQLLLSRFAFLQSKDCLGVKNRRLFFIYSYFTFFYNIYLGFFSCILRMAMNATLCLLFLGRLDFSLMARTWESRDAGYKAYLGFLHVHHAHSNPHMLTFVHLLTQHSIETARTSQVHTRWRLAYTLHHNRGLVVHRKKHLAEVKSKMERLHTSVCHESCHKTTKISRWPLSMRSQQEQDAEAGVPLTNFN